MWFIFEDGTEETEALVTALRYDTEKSVFEFTVLGLDDDRFSYTNQGKAWCFEEDLEKLLHSEEIEFPHDIVGRKMKFISNSYICKKELYDHEEFVI